MARGGHGGMRMGGGGGGMRGIRHGGGHGGHHGGHGGHGRRVIIRGGGGGWWPGYYGYGGGYNAQLLAYLRALAIAQQNQQAAVVVQPTDDVAMLRQAIEELSRQVAMLQGQVVQQGAQPQPVMAPFIPPSDGGGYKG